MNKWEEVEKQISSIEDMSQFNAYIFKTITQALITVFPNSIIEETAFNKSRLFFDFFIDLQEMRLFIDIKYSKNLIVEFWEKQLPIILSQLSKVKEKERKKTKFLLIYVESTEPLESFGIEIDSPNLLIISLKNLLEIQNQIQFHSDKLLVFEMIINNLSGFITGNFVEAYKKFLMIYENFDPLKFYDYLKEFLKNINASLLKIMNQEILDKYDISIQFSNEKIKIINAIFEREPLKLLEISKAVNISDELTSLIQFYFINENIFKQNGETEFSFNIGIAPFKKILQLIFYLEDKTFLINLYKSAYLQRSLSSLVEYTKNRFFIKGEDNLEEIKKIIELFPSALFYCLFEEKKLPFFKNASKDENFNTYDAFKDNIFSKIIEDLFNNKDLMKDIFVYNKILDYKFLGNMILLKEANKFLDFKTEVTISIVKLKEGVSIEAGAPVFLPDLDQLVNLVAKDIQFKDYLGAIKKCDDFLAKSELEKNKIHFLINQGVAYAHLGKFSKAIQNYNKALKIKELPIIYKNLSHAWFNKYIQVIKQQTEFKIDLVEILEFLNNAKINLETVNLFDKNELTDVSFKDLKDLEHNIKEEFETIFNQSIKLISPNQIPYVLFQARKIDNNFIKLIYDKNSEEIDKLLDMEYHKLDPNLWNSLAIVYSELGKNQAAFNCIEKAQKVCIEKSNFFVYLDTKAEVLLNMKKYKEALVLFNQILEKDKDDIRVKHFYAESCWKAAKTERELGKKERFRELMQIAYNLRDEYCYDEKIRNKIEKDWKNL